MGLRLPKICLLRIPILISDFFPLLGVQKEFKSVPNDAPVRLQMA
jgi:hypothetical protein